MTSSFSHLQLHFLSFKILYQLHSCWISFWCGELSSLLFFLLNWNIVYLWYCVSFRYTAKWFSCLFQVCFHYRLLQYIKYSSQYCCCCCCCCCCCITSVVSDSVRPHRRQPTRLLCPWDIPGKNTGMVCHFLLQCILSCFSHVWLCITPGTAAHQAPLSMEFSGQEYWSGLPFPSPLCITVLVYFTYGSIYLLISNFNLSLSSFPDW